MELNVISGATTNKIGKRNYLGTTNIIEEILEGNKNVRKMKKELSLCVLWTTTSEGRRRIEVYDRKEINEIIKFYKKIIPG